MEEDYFTQLDNELHKFIVGIKNIMLIIIHFIFMHKFCVKLKYK